VEKAEQVKTASIISAEGDTEAADLLASAFAKAGEGLVCLQTIIGALNYLYLNSGLWIRIDLLRIRIQHFCSIRIRFRIQDKTELSKITSLSNFFEIKI
jgi:hypothetical protein